MTEPLSEAAASLGLAFLAKRAFTGDRLDEVWAELVRRAGRDPNDAGALMDLSLVAMLTGDRKRGLELQAAALRLNRAFRTAHGTGQGLKVLVFMTPGDLTANTPVDFLFEGSDAQVIGWFVDGALPSPADVPPHDVAVLAISQSESAPEALAALPSDLDAWPRPVINGRPDRIAALSRDGVAERLAGHPELVCPLTRRLERAALEAAAQGRAELGAFAPELAYPIILRPLSSHAGHDLEKIDDAEALGAYLAAHAHEAQFFAAQFLDYSGADGLFRKLRVMFIGGCAYVAHMAVSARWMVHYLNADMGEARHRAEEAALMATFDEGFAVRHARAFEAITEAFGLDYVGIDCAETRDGRLVVFEADVAMLVHDMDPVELYPYKKPAMARLFRGFIRMLGRVAQGRRLAA
jgi:hypothetical protein